MKIGVIMQRRKILMTIGLVVFVGVSILSVKDCFARKVSAGTGSGASHSATSEIRGALYKSGVSWVHYIYNTTSTTGGTVIAPDYHFYGTYAEISNTCRETADGDEPGGFYLLVINGYDHSVSENPAANGWTGLMDVPAGTTTLSEAYNAPKPPMVGLGLNPPDSTAGDSYAKEYVDWSVAQKLYEDEVQNTKYSRGVWGAANNDLTWFCYGPKMRKREGTFTSQSVVYFENNTSKPVVDGTSEWTNEKGETKYVVSDDNVTTLKVKFRHDLIVQGEAVMGPLNDTQNFKTGLTVEKQHYKSDNTYENKQFTTHGGSWSVLSGAGTADVQKVRKGVIEEWGTVTIPKTAGKEVTACSKVTVEPAGFTYNISKKTVSYKQNKNSSRACITFVRGTSSEGGSFESQSSVTYNGTSSVPKLDGDSIHDTVTIADPNIKQVDLEFKHDLVVAGLEEKYLTSGPNAYTYFKVTSQNAGYEKASTKTTVHSRSDGFKLSSSGETDGMYVYSGRNTNKVTVTLPTSGSKTYCEIMTIKPANFTINDNKFTPEDSSSSSSKACITFKRTAGGDPNNPGGPGTGCPTGLNCVPSPVSTPNYGNTTARVGVTNLNNGTSQTTSDGEDNSRNTVTIYAKPGDSIQFAHTLGFGAQAVTGDSGSVAANTFRISASPANHLFGNNSVLASGGSGSISRTSTYAAADITSNYGMTIVSPNAAAMNRYSCWANQDFQLAYEQPGYQVMGFGTNPVNCNAASVAKGSETYDAGKTFSQSLDWANVKAWKTYKHTSGGSCGCSESSAWASNTYLSSYEQARSAGGSWGQRERYCKTSGRCGCCYEYCWSCLTNYSLYDRITYPYTSSSTAGARKTAEVKVPYNFKTAVNSNFSTGSNGVVQAGESATISVSASILPRSNPLVDTSKDYATVTPADTQLQVVQFMINPSAPSNVAGGLSAVDPCSYYLSRFSAYSPNCIPVYAERRSYNEQGSWNGATAINRSFTISVPDVEVGTKLCVAIGISHADSHNLPDGNLSSGDGANSYSMGTGSPQWRISGASCRTIAKKPNFQVWGAGIYTDRGITTSQSPKNVGVGLSNTPSTTALFGSWAEYTAISPSRITGFGSAAALGYSSNTHANPSGHSATTDYCQLTHLSIANTNCIGSSGTAGNAYVVASSANMLSRIKSRYTDNSIEANQNGVLDLGTAATLANGSVYAKSNGNIAINSAVLRGRQTNAAINNTLVIHAAGTVYINNNLCYGGGLCGINSGVLSLAGRNMDTYGNISELPQIIVIAKNIEISPAVTQVDAWLIAEADSYGNGGNINTCNGFSAGGTDANGCNQTIIFNGPVFAKTISLNRTAGAYPGYGSNESAYTRNLASDGSVTPAEIFNMRADTMYWAYNQAQRYSQAVVTYTRELAPRY